MTIVAQGVGYKSASKIIHAMTKEPIELTFNPEDVFLIFGFRMAYDFHISDETKLQLYAGVQTIFNQSQKYHDSGMFRDAGYIYGPCKPRTISLGVKIGNLF